MWDELAASVAAGETYTTTEQMSIAVVEGGSDDGNTARGQGNRVTVAISVDDPDAFYANFLTTLAGSPVEVGSAATPEEEAYLTAVQDSFSDLEQAFEVVFSDNPALQEEAEFDGPAFAEGLNLIMTAMATSYEIVSDLEPPASLAEIHTSYLAEMMSIVEAKDELVDAVAAATSREEVDTILLAVSFDDACLPIAERAGLLGIDLQLPCG
jgi:hypothetical protein